MKLIAEKLTGVILEESSKSFEDKKVKEFEQILADIKKTGCFFNTKLRPAVAGG